MATKEREICFYCSALISGDGTGQGDHFPLPNRAGGEVVVPRCTSCHDMKDRFPLSEWPIEWVQKIIEDFPKLSRETKIFLAKSMFLYVDYLNQKKPKKPDEKGT